MTKCEALLDLLSDGREHDMTELQRIGGWRYGGRLHELRRRGHTVLTITVKRPNHFAYQLVKEPVQGALL